MENERNTLYDAIVIGSGFGGSFAAYPLVQAGMKVLMLERGEWVKRGVQNWDPDMTGILTPYYTMEIPYRIRSGGEKKIMGSYACVGGPSVFFGGVSIRFREADFESHSEISGDSLARWPYSYEELEPYYTRVEKILNIAGEEGCDPTEPRRSTPYPQSLNGFSNTSQMIFRSSQNLGLSPFRLPLAINYSSSANRPHCICCTTCDTFACAISAKNDLATSVLPFLIRKGLDLSVNTVVTRLVTEGDRVVALECYEKRTGQKRSLRAKQIILSAGALGSPHLLLASGLTHSNPAGHSIGHYLMRHCSAFVFGIFREPPNRAKEFHKQIGIHDFYFGHSTIKNPPGKLGNIQQVQTPPLGLVHASLPKPFGKILGKGIDHITGLLVIAEDQPQYNNSVTIDRKILDRFGLPQLIISHQHSKRDYAARRALIDKAKTILRHSGARLFYFYNIRSFSHAVGSVRMGEDPNASPLDSYCQFRGLQNLFVVDGSFMPSSAGLNPSLTIAANALRVGEYITRQVFSE